MEKERRVVLITGASSGIGLACATYLARQGFRVYGTSRRALTDPGAYVPGTVSMIAMDVTDDGSVRRAVETVLGREGRLDIVVNNAGSGIAGSVESTSIEEARDQFEVNFFGVFRVCRAVLPAMQKQREGYIVNIGSIGGVIAIPYQGMYSASKFALEGLSEALRLELRNSGIHVVIVQPGDHRTAFTEHRRLTEGSRSDSLHRRAFQAALERMTQDEQRGPGPERIARLLERIVRSRRPRLRYTVGPAAERGAVWMKRLLANAIVERGVRLYYRLDGPSGGPRQRI